MRRRGLIAGAAALAAAVVATRTAQPVGATQVVGTNGYTGTLDSSADGVQGYANDSTSAGVFGRNNVLNGVGVLGVAPSGIGVSGQSTNGPGLSATSTNGYGIYTQSTNSHGLIGVSNGAYQVAVGGQAGVATAYGVVGTNTFGGWAGWFNGGVYITGSLTVGGSYPKSAAVPMPDGTHALMYCVEAPESWFEDVGQADLVGGKASVALDPDFAATVLTGNYHVFLTPYGDCKGLAVTNRTATGFAVQEVQGGASSLAFSWRVMAKRKDITGERLARITPPTPVALVDAARSPRTPRRPRRIPPSRPAPRRSRRARRAPRRRRPDRRPPPRPQA